MSNSSSTILVAAGFGHSANLRALVILIPIIQPFRKIEIRLSVHFLPDGQKTKLRVITNRSRIGVRVGV